MKNKLILIGGGTASGKTLISDDVFTTLNSDNVSVAKLKMDNYYKDMLHYPNKKVSEVNWDSPESIQWEDLLHDIEKLMEGEAVVRKRYIFETAEYTDEIIETLPEDYIIVEGLFALYNDKLNKMATIRIYVQADSDIRVMRRLKRDKEIRFKDFDETEFFDKWINNLKPMHDKYVRPTKINAHMTLQTSNNEFDQKKLVESVNIIVKLIK